MVHITKTVCYINFMSLEKILVNSRLLVVRFLGSPELNADLTAWTVGSPTPVLFKGQQYIQLDYLKLH